MSAAPDTEAPKRDAPLANEAKPAAFPESGFVVVAVPAPGALCVMTVGGLLAARRRRYSRLVW